MKPRLPGEIDPKQIISLAQSQTRNSFDPVEGGQKGQPKFPSSLSLPFLLQQSQHQNSQARKMAQETLFKMASGGIYDHIAGGFHRYSVDSKWMIPHFEKMLYDNAQLANDYIRGEQLFPNQGFGGVATDILDYLLREMQTPNGGFYSATDADSLGPSGHREEGYYFSWTPEDVKSLLGKDAHEFSSHFHVTNHGNFEGRTVLYAKTPISNWLQTDQRHATWRAEFYEERQKRPSPLRDEKILTAWNGLALSAFANGYRQFNDKSYLEAAIKIVDLVEEHLNVQGQLYRSFSQGKAQHLAYIEDHAFYISGLLDLFESSFDPKYLSLAIHWDQRVQEGYEDPEGGWYRTHNDADQLLVREMPMQDKAEPCGASFMLRNLLRLQALTTADSYRKRIDLAFARYGQILKNYPLSLDDMLIAVDWKLHPPQEVIISTTKLEESLPFLSVLKATDQNYILVVLNEKNREKINTILPSTNNKLSRGGEATAYVCQQGVCQFPVTTAKDFQEALKRK